MPELFSRRNPPLAGPRPLDLRGDFALEVLVKATLLGVVVFDAAIAAGRPSGRDTPCGAGAFGRTGGGVGIGDIFFCLYE